MAFQYSSIVAGALALTCLSSASEAVRLHKMQMKVNFNSSSCRATRQKCGTTAGQKWCSWIGDAMNAIDSDSQDTSYFNAAVIYDAILQHDEDHSDNKFFQGNDDKDHRLMFAAFIAHVSHETDHFKTAEEHACAGKTTCTIAANGDWVIMVSTLAGGSCKPRGRSTTNRWMIT